LSRKKFWTDVNFILEGLRCNKHPEGNFREFERELKCFIVIPICYVLFDHYRILSFTQQGMMVREYIIVAWQEKLRRLYTIQKVLGRVIKQVGAAGILSPSSKQVGRIIKRIRAECKKELCTDPRRSLSTVEFKIK